jgi:hypothetical protein
MLGSADAEVRALAAAALATYKNPLPGAIPALIQSLGDVLRRLAHSVRSPREHPRPIRLSRP